MKFILLFSLLFGFQLSFHTHAQSYPSKSVKLAGIQPE